MNRARDEFLPSARFPADQHSGICGCHRFHLLQHFAQGGTLPDNLCEVHLRADFFFQVELFLGEFVLQLGDLTVGQGVFDGNCDLARGLTEEVDVCCRKGSLRFPYNHQVPQRPATPSAAASLYPSPPPGQPISSTVATVGFIVSNARLPGSSSAGVMIRSSLAKPLLLDASNAYSLNVPASSPGNQTPAPSQRISSRKLAEIARSTSRRSRFEVMRVVRFRSNCRRSFCRCRGSRLSSPLPLIGGAPLFGTVYLGTHY